MSLFDGGSTWRKSTFSGGDGCVEVCPLLESGGVAVRSSRDPDGPQVHFSRREWEAFIAGVLAGEFTVVQ
jgi:hypothetical protein